MKKIVFLVLTLSIACSGFSQNKQPYMKAPDKLAKIVSSPSTPGITFSPDKTYYLELSRPGFAGIEDISAEMLRIGGLRIDPAINGRSRPSYYDGIKLLKMNTGESMAISGLPENYKISDISWSPDEKHIAFINYCKNGIELWNLNVETGQAMKVLPAVVNACMGSAFSWSSDSKYIYCKRVPENRGDAPVKNNVPEGPVVRENKGQVAAVRTYQDLLSNSYDEALFAYYTTSTVVRVDMNGLVEEILTAGIYSRVSLSPDAKYIMTEEIRKPFSYIVPYYSFAKTYNAYTCNGEFVKELAELPVTDQIPKGFGAVHAYARNISWRPDLPASLVYVKALDGGDPKMETDFRDQVYVWEAPFTQEAKPLVKTALRFWRISWGNDELAVISEDWRETRESRMSFFNPSQTNAETEIIFKLSSEDRYNDPGTFVTTRNEFGRSVLQFDKREKKLFMVGTGASPEGDRPFLNEFVIKSKEINELWRCEGEVYESFSSFIDPDRKVFLTTLQSVHTPSNYYVRDLRKKTIKQITSFEDPYEDFSKVQKKKIYYAREDGVKLSATLYLPEDFKEGDSPLPALLWAYPREYKSAKAASQVSGSPYRFTRVRPTSASIFALMGYAVIDGASFPIIGEGDEQPNDHFVEQLVANAKAAIDKVAGMGICDPKRVAVGGHSYGAFMTANLLSHSDLFAAGIARSGAYNRTLTPFGFQAEPRTYWEAPEIYYRMSPFSYANQVKAPILLIHGIADNNSGTFPIQSERYYAALKGHGATVRLVMLPQESHGYVARESLLHMLWEMNHWLDIHVKNK